MSSTNASPPTVLAAPPDFPVVWKDPADETLFWLYDRLHFPEPVTPAEFSFVEIMDQGFNQALQTYGYPLAARERHINSYVYGTLVPQEYSPEEMLSLAQSAVRKLNADMENLESHWQEEWLPEIRQHLTYWETYDLCGAPLSALIEHLEETKKRLNRIWEIHFLLDLAGMLAISQFDELYQDLFDGAGSLAAYELLAGFPNKTIESGQWLWKLSRQAVASPTVYKICSETPAADVTAQLATEAEGRAFLKALNAYLEAHGQRSEGWTLHKPFWIEDPTSVIEDLQHYLTQPDRDLLAEIDEIAAKRERLVAEARSHLAGYPQPVIAQFESSLKAAQVGNMLKEDHGYWIDFKTCYQTRRLLLEWGKRLVEARVMEAQDDIFYLSLDELREIVVLLPAAPNRQAQINARKAIEQQFAVVAPPPILGTLPDGPPPDDPFLRMLLKAEGDVLPPAENPDELKGHAGSAGIVQGPAKVVRSLAETTKIEPGDILVAETTAPSWTPLFARIRGIVTDTGGVLCHSAVVAREYGIPAVIGTGVATSVIQDGTIIEVNGNIGLVRIVGH